MPNGALLDRDLIAWPWIAWALYWVIAAARAKATRRRESFGSRLSHLAPLVVGGALLGFGAAPWGWLGQRLWPRALPVDLIALALLYGGLAFAVWARVHLGGNWSGSVTIKAGHELVSSGPYAWVRHPIYTGLLAAALGTAIASATLRAALGFVIISVALLRKLHKEEAFMRETFPHEYPRYCAQVPALLPFIRARRSAPR
jgi:protein-S-isoprenylcysteine O-methyltransferase Ste14